MQTHIAPVPPPEAFDEQQNYSRALDRRLNQAIKPPPPRYDGMIPVYVPSSLSVSVAVDSGEGIIASIELALSPEQFDKLCPFLNGSIVQLFLRSMRPESTEIVMEHQIAPSKSQATTGINLDENKFWKD